MNAKTSDERLLLRYLLGELPEQEQEQVEDRVFQDSEYRNALENAEADLIDEYVRRGLPDDERRKFERQFLISPRRRNKIEFARALAAVAAESPGFDLPASRKSAVSWLPSWGPMLQWASAAMLLLGIVAVSWLSYQNQKMHSQLARLESERGLPQLGGPPSKGQPAGTNTIASLILLPGLTRGEMQANQLRLASAAQLARIEVHLEPRDSYSRYRAELRTQNGLEIVTLPNLAARRTPAGLEVVFDVPASLLAAGEYELALQGLGRAAPVDIAYFYFRVTAQ